jgi:hypothetical protein
LVAVLCRLSSHGIKALPVISAHFSCPSHITLAFLSLTYFATLRFQRIDKDFRQIMEAVGKDKNVLNLASLPNLTEMVSLMLNQLERYHTHYCHYHVILHDKSHHRILQ